MENKNIFDLKFNRRKIFSIAGSGTAIYIYNKIFPFKHSIKNYGLSNSEIIIKLNPHAVSRNKKGSNNV